MFHKLHLSYIQYNVVISYSEVQTYFVNVFQYVSKNSRRVKCKNRSYPDLIWYRKFLEKLNNSD